MLSRAERAVRSLRGIGISRAAPRLTGYQPATRRALLKATIGLIGAGFVAGANAVPVRADTEVLPNELVLGLVPALSPRRFVGLFGPLADYLSAELGIPVRMEGAPSFADYLTRIVEEQRYDLTISGADLYYFAQVRAGYRAIVKLAGPGVKLVIVTRRDGGIADIGQLPGHSVATADPLSFSTRTGRMTLREHGIDPDRDVEIVVTQNLNAAMLSMLNGLTDAAMFFEPVLLRADEETRNQIRILAESEALPPHPISVGPRISDALAFRLQQSLLAFGSKPEGEVFFREMGWPGFAAAAPEDYAAMSWVLEDMDRELANVHGD